MAKRKKKKKSYGVRWIILIVITILFGIYLKNTFFSIDTSSTTTPIISTNDNYAGIGQKNVSGKDGYITTFTTTNGKTYKEYKQNGDSSWAERYYWGGTMAENGCGITCLATLASRL